MEDWKKSRVILVNMSVIQSALWIWWPRWPCREVLQNLKLKQREWFGSHSFQTPAVCVVKDGGYTEEEPGVWRYRARREGSVRRCSIIKGSIGLLRGKRKLDQWAPWIARSQSPPWTPTASTTESVRQITGWGGRRAGRWTVLGKWNTSRSKQRRTTSEIII